MSYVFPSLMSVLPGARVLVAGGTGTVGSGVTLAALKQGAKVIVVTRSQEKFEELRTKLPEQYHPYLSPIVADLRQEHGAKYVLNEVIQRHEIQHVVASLQGNKTWWRMGRLMDQPLKDFNGIAPTEAKPHFLMMKAFLPYLEPQLGSTYTVVTGYPGSGDTARGTSSSLLCVAMGMVHGLVRGAMEEFAGAHLAISQVHLKCLVRPLDDDKLQHLGPKVLGHDLVGEAIVSVAARGLREKVSLTSRDMVRELAGRRKPLPFLPGAGQGGPDKHRQLH